MGECFSALLLPSPDKMSGIPDQQWYEECTRYQVFLESVKLKMLPLHFVYCSPIFDVLYLINILIIVILTAALILQFFFICRASANRRVKNKV